MSQEKIDQSVQEVRQYLEENHSTNQIFGNTDDATYINELTTKYASSTDYFGVTHPSLPTISQPFRGISSIFGTIVKQDQL